MQVLSSFHIGPPHSSPESTGPMTSCSSSSALFLSRLSTKYQKAVHEKDNPEESTPYMTDDDQNSPKKPDICGFSPLPSIIASSPLCSFSSQIWNNASQAAEDIVISESNDTPTCTPSVPIFFPAKNPTWIATPPTPTSKHVRRSNSASGRRSSIAILSPSPSFPVLLSERGDRKVFRRSTSVPIFDLHERKSTPNIMNQEISEALSSYSEYPVDVISQFGDEPKIEPNSTSTTDNEDGKSTRCSPEEPSPEGSWSEHSIETIWETERKKDALRKFYALKELLATEVGYLADLKALVTIYLRDLPSLAARALAPSSTFGRASSSFTNGPWIHSYTQLQAVALSSSSTLPETQNIHAPSSGYMKESSKITFRYLFTDAELEALIRNAEEIFKLHEHFVRELRAILEPLGFTMQHNENGQCDISNLDDAIRAVSTKFATEASRFNAYQVFCAGHPEAMGIARKVAQQFPLEMDAYEQRCSAMVNDAVSSQNSSIEDRKTATVSSLDGAARILRPRPSLLIPKDSVAFPAESRRDKTFPRISFTDYMIKPIQRICKYPLLLDQLLPSKQLRTRTLPQRASADVDVIVESAAQAMRHVASSVDEARHRQDIAIQSALIFSRICFGSPSSLDSSGVQILSHDFFASLGNCLLSGSLDVMYYHTPLGHTSSVKAKYFGAFLYKGGYLILVKTLKGRKYEPRHWFSLVDFEVTGIEDDGALLPCSFKLSSGNNHFELAAACQREKDTWLSSIRESLKHNPSWINEPTPSFRFDEKGELLPSLEESLSDPPGGLPTIRSIPELSHASDPESSEPFFASLRGNAKSKKKKPRYEASYRQDAPPPPTRRSSSTSVKAIFLPASDSETIVIRRSSQAARLQVDQEIQDVISLSVLTARSYAFSHEMELFQAPKSRNGFSRSNSSIGMAGMARLSKHESVRVPRRRTTDSLDTLLSRRNSPLKNKTYSAGRRKFKKLSITSLNDVDFLNSRQDDVSPCSSPPSSQSSSHMASLPSEPLAIPPSPFGADNSPLKSRTFVRNVKGLFQLRPVSPVSVIITHPSQTSVPSSAPLTEFNGKPSTQILHRWTKQSLRRRARSAPDDPNTIFKQPESPFPTATASILAT